eukprot:XP_001610102.1 hypothetical protein [Babesia bovis T2Bo]
MLNQDNGRLVRLGTTLIPRDVEIMLHLINSPILHDSMFDPMAFSTGILPHFQMIGFPHRLTIGGPSYTLAVALLENNPQRLKHYKEFKRDETSWPTYIDNEAAYTYLWRMLADQVSVKRNRVDGNPKKIIKNMKYLYRNDRNELMLYKYRIRLNREKHYKFVAMISQWSVRKLPVNRKYLELLDKLLINHDRSAYAEELFENIGHFSKYVNYHGNTGAPSTEEILALPLLKPKLTKDESLDIEVQCISNVTIKLAHNLLANMLEKHAVPAFKSLRNRKRLHRIRGVTGVTRHLRITINDYLETSPKVAVFELNTSPEEREEIEEMLFESSYSFHPYWNMKNDTLYNKSADIMLLDDTQQLNLLFDAERVFRKLLNINARHVDFKFLHDVLHRLTAPQTPSQQLFPRSPLDTCRAVQTLAEKVEEQYLSLSSFVRDKLVAKCRCLLAFLYLFGVPDESGNLEIPGGWPRNIASSLSYMTEGVGASCGLCNAVLGFLSAIGYPPVANNMYAWETRNTHGESTVYQMLVTSKGSKRQKHTEYFDKILLSYLSGHYKYDDASNLAMSYYIYSGIGNPSRILDDSLPSSGIERIPKSIGSKCIDALPYVIEAAKSAMRTKNQSYNGDGADEFRSRKYAEFVKKLANMGDVDGLRVMGDFHYVGHEAGNISVNVPRALEYWSRAAQNGDVTSALTMATHLIDMLNQIPRRDVDYGDMEDAPIATAHYNLNPNDRAHLESAAERYLRIAANSNNALASATARFYMTRYGLGTQRDPIAAARYLQEAADRGDIASQILMGHAYAGMLNDITPPDGKNVFTALEYYRRAAKGGNLVAIFNTAVLTLHGYDLKFNSSVERCKASFSLFQKVGRYSLLPSVVRILSKRAKRVGDDIGHTLLNMFLSEMGDPDAHIAAAKHFKYNNRLCYVDKTLSPLRSQMNSYTPDGTLIQGAGNDHENEQNNGNESTQRGILHAVTHETDSPGTSLCHLYYARRSAHEVSGGSPLLLAEALLERDPKQSAEWMLEAKVRNENKATYLYAMMLEAGAGVKQDCAASYDYYTSMVYSRDYRNKLLGFLCIQRTRITRWLHGYTDLYKWFVVNFYDTPIVNHLQQKGYEPCSFAMPEFPNIANTKEIVITTLFVLVVSLLGSIYLKAR